MIIGLIGFGKVSRNLVQLISSDDIDFVTSAENRSPETLHRIKNSDVKVFDTFQEVVETSDILISANSPKSALEVSKKYGKEFNGIYLDLNNVSPDTISEIDKNVENLIDGAIIGKIDSDNPVLYISGDKSDELLFLNEFIPTLKVSNASLLKMLRSSYTKTISALLIESYEIAVNNNLEDEFFDILSLTEGDDFKEKSLSRITNTLNNSKRKSEELDELIKFFNANDLTMAEAALEKLSR